MNNKFMLLTGITESWYTDLSSLFKMNFIKIELFDSVFTEAINKFSEIKYEEKV